MEYGNGKSAGKIGNESEKMRGTGFMSKAGGYGVFEIQEEKQKLEEWLTKTKILRSVTAV